MPWWGDTGVAPHLRYPGVTINIPCRWVPLDRKGLQEERVDGEVVWLRKGRVVPTWWVEAGGRWESPDGRYYFDLEAGDRAVDFYPLFLRHHMGEFVGQPFELLDYQKVLLSRPLFGWKRTNDHLRRFRKVFAFLPKGAGKSPWGAGTGLYLAASDGEAAAEVYALASDRMQARTVHDNAKVMVEESPDLAEMAEITKDAISFPASRSTYMVLSSDAGSAHGKRPHGIVYDELHAAKDRTLFEALRKSMAKRRQPVLIIISHAGEDDEGICYEEYELAKKVLSGTLPDDTCLPVIFEAAPEDDWTDPAVWQRVNPGHGITIKHDGVAQECLEAQAEPRKLNDFLRYHLNRWVGQAEAWIPIDGWDRCDAPLPPIEELAAAPMAVGIDMAQKIDLAAAVAVFRLPLPGAADMVEIVAVDDQGNVTQRALPLNYQIAVVPMFWLPEDTLRERVKVDRVPYDIWAQGDEPLLRTVEGAIVDSEAIAKYVLEDLPKRYPLVKQAEIGYDPAFATEVHVRLAAGGMKTVEVLQNYKYMSEACQVFEALVKAKRVIHGGHRLLRWNVENVAVKRDDAGRIRPVKPKKAAKRIDGVVAILMALYRLMAAPVQAPPPPPPKPRVSVLRW